MRKVPPAVASATCAHATATRSRGTIDRCKVWRPSFTCRRTSRQRAHVRPPSTSRPQERPPHRKPSSKGVKDPTDLPESRPLSGSRAVTATRRRSTAFAKEHLLASETSLGYMDCCRVRTLREPPHAGITPSHAPYKPTYSRQLIRKHWNADMTCTKR